MKNIVTQKNLIIIQMLVGIATVVFLAYQIKAFRRSEKKLEENGL